MKVALKLRIRGRVQGVGFRESLRAEAERLGATGWVRNRQDGSVEAVVQGDSAIVNELRLWAQRGPASAKVENLDAEELPFDISCRNFSRMPTL